MRDFALRPYHRGRDSGAHRVEVEADGAFFFNGGCDDGTAALDVGYTGLDRDDDGLARVRIEAPGTGRAATLWMDAAYEYLMVFTGDTLSPAARRRGLALEPMTCAPNALQSGDGLVVLEPGASHSGKWGICPG